VKGACTNVVYAGNIANITTKPAPGVGQRQL
jgi:hypothetical protein